MVKEDNNFQMNQSNLSSSCHQPWPDDVRGWTESAVHFFPAVFCFSLLFCEHIFVLSNVNISAMHMLH